jgi:hypothetical protein
MVQLVICLGHFYSRTTFWVWLGLMLYVPLMFVANCVGNAWLKSDDYTNTCLKTEVTRVLAFSYLVLTYTLSFALTIRICRFVSSMRNFFSWTCLEVQPCICSQSLADL